MFTIQHVVYVIKQSVSPKIYVYYWEMVYYSGVYYYQSPLYIVLFHRHFFFLIKTLFWPPNVQVQDLYTMTLAIAVVVVANQPTRHRFSWWRALQCSPLSQQITQWYILKNQILKKATFSDIQNKKKNETFKKKLFSKFFGNFLPLW